MRAPWGEGKGGGGGGCEGEGDAPPDATQFSPIPRRMADVVSLTTPLTAYIATAACGVLITYI